MDSFQIKDEDRALLVNQLVFDVLLISYMGNEFNKKMSLNKYCKEYAYYDYEQGNKWVKGTDPKNHPNGVALGKVATYKLLERQAERISKAMNNPELAGLYRKLGINFDEDIANFAEAKRRPRIIWDHFFQAGNKLMITSRQFRRDFFIEDEADYATFAEALNYYDKFVEAAYTGEDVSHRPSEYFRRSMDYYLLETHNRIDFIYKISEILENKKPQEYNKINFLGDVFTASVACPHYCEADDGNWYIGFEEQEKSYLPIMLTDKSCSRTLIDILEESDNNPFLDDDLIMIYRAKAYELFMYHYAFNSEDYDDMSEFIRNNFDVLSFHEKNKLWNIDYSKIDEEKIEKLIPAEDLELLGIDKDTYARILVSVKYGRTFYLVVQYDML